jgi:hypothetical protein
VRYSANAIIDFINRPENGFIIDGGIPRCPKGDDCIDSIGNCTYITGCHQTVRFFQEKTERHHYGYFRLNFTFPLHQRIDNDGYIEESNGSLSFLVDRNIISRDVLIAV